MSLIYLCLLVTGTARTFLWAASASFLPQLVERKDFSHAVTWNSGTFQIGSITGPAIGGIILHYTHHAAWIYAFNALAAVSCAALVGRVQVHHVAVAAERTGLKNLLTGFRFVFHNRIILGIITLDMFAVLLGGATALLPVLCEGDFARWPVRAWVVTGGIARRRDPLQCYLPTSSRSAKIFSGGNIEHPTSNIERPMTGVPAGSELDVGCSMLDV